LKRKGKNRKGKKRKGKKRTGKKRKGKRRIENREKEKRKKRTGKNRKETVTACDKTLLLRRSFVYQRSLRRQAQLLPGSTSIGL
jgi:hypothetical protein